MNAISKQKVAALSVTVAALVGGATALAATSQTKKTTVAHSTASIFRFTAHATGVGGGLGPSDDLDAAAAYLGVTSAALQSDLQSGKTLAGLAGATSGESASGLISALVAAETTEWDARVTAGALTKTQETALLPTLTQRFTDLVNGTGGPGFGGPGGPGHGPGGPGGPSDDLDAAAAYLGVTSAALQSDLQSGKTLAGLAGATSGESASGLISALVAAETTEWDARVTAGALTKTQETALLPTLTQRFTDLVNGTGGPGGPGFGGPGFGGPGPYGH